MKRELGGALLATLYALGATSVLMRFFGQQMPPRFADVFLVGIGLCVVFFTWRVGLWLYVVSMAIALWLLPPADSFRVSAQADFYRLASYSACSFVAIWVLHALTRPRRQAEMRRASVVDSPQPAGAAPVRNAN